MLDTYTQLPITAKNCFIDEEDPIVEEGEHIPCPVTLEVSYVKDQETFPLIDILTAEDIRYFSKDSLENGTLK